jgi:DNA mismatch repair ATPase MutS
MNENILKQFYELKSNHPDAILLFRTGDFYEAYKEDAKKASDILDIALTKSTIQKDSDDNTIELISFPFYALDTYLPKLIRAGQRVAICNKLEDPNTKKLIKQGSKESVSNNK